MNTQEVPKSREMKVPVVEHLLESNHIKKIEIL